MNIPPITIVALLLAVGYVLYRLARRALRKSDDAERSLKKTGSGKKGGQEPDKAAALEKFKAAHSAARDPRKQIQQNVKEDPNRAVKALRSMMKR